MWPNAMGRYGEINSVQVETHIALSEIHSRLPMFCSPADVNAAQSKTHVLAQCRKVSTHSVGTGVGTMARHLRRSV
jgi:hypothetical protein